MPAPDAIPPDKLAQLIGTPRCPVLPDVRSTSARAACPRLVPAARPLAEAEITRGALAPLAASLTDQVLVTCAGDVAPAEVAHLANMFGAMPHDIEGVFRGDRGALCTFDTMLAELGLASPPLDRVASTLRGADTARPDLAAEAVGLLAASPGLSRMYSDDLEQLDAGMALHDAFHRWARDATIEVHDWPTSRQGRAA